MSQYYISSLIEIHSRQKHNVTYNLYFGNDNNNYNTRSIIIMEELNNINPILKNYISNIILTDYKNYNI